MTKQDEYRFNLKFDEADEDHRRVSEFLNKCGRKYCEGSTCLLGVAKRKNADCRTVSENTHFTKRDSYSER